MSSSSSAEEREGDPAGGRPPHPGRSRSCGLESGRSGPPHRHRLPPLPTPRAGTRQPDDPDASPRGDRAEDRGLVASSLAARRSVAQHAPAVAGAAEVRAHAGVARHRGEPAWVLRRVSDPRGLLHHDERSQQADERTVRNLIHAVDGTQKERVMAESLPQRPTLQSRAKVRIAEVAPPDASARTVDPAAVWAP